MFCIPSKLLNKFPTIKFQTISGLENSTLEPIYDDTIAKAEKFSGPTNLIAAMIALQFVMLPKFFTSLFLWFATDVGGDALKLPNPMW